MAFVDTWLRSFNLLTGLYIHFDNILIVKLYLQQIIIHYLIKTISIKIRFVSIDLILLDSDSIAI